MAGLGATSRAAVERWRVLVERAAKVAAPAAFDASFGATTSNGLVLDGSCQAALLFGSSSPSLTDSDAFELAKRLLEAYMEEATTSLDDFVRDEPLSILAQPWAHGYDLAEDLLDSEAWTRLSTDTATDIKGFLTEHAVSVAEIDIADIGMRAVSFASPNHRPTLLMNVSWVGYSNASARRFTMAHELCHLLYDRTYGAQLAVASGPWAPQALEQRANAFAAMLLMPTARLQRINSATPFDTASRDTLIRVARGLGVPLTALIDHLYNLDLLDETARERLRLRDQI